MKRMISASTTEKELITDSPLSKIGMDMLDIIKRLQYQRTNASTDEQEAAITEAIISIRRAYNRIR